MKTTKLSLTAVMALGLISSVQAAESIEGMFKEGKVNGSLRFNSFMWDWDDHDDSKTSTKNNPTSQIAAVGGSLLYKTAPLHGISLGTAFYTSQPISAFGENMSSTKSGGDLDLRSETGESINVLGQAYIQYDISQTTATVGRQLINTPLTNANDSKMVPNAFNAYTMTSKDIKDLNLFASWITSMKPRNEDKFNDIMSNDADTPKNLRKTYRGNVDGLLITGAQYTGIKGVKLEGWDYKLDGILNTYILEANYNFNVSDVKVNIGGRYLRQLNDYSGDSAGVMQNVASFGGSATGYNNAKSLDGALYAARIQATLGAFKAHFGMSRTDDKADIVAPWRGFPTGGYTRPMKIENWDANIKSWMASLTVDLDKLNLVKGTNFNVNYLIDDRDETKAQPKGDMKSITADLNHKFACVKGLEGRLRMGYHNDKGNVYYANGTTTAGPRVGWDFTEYRAELMYKF